MKVPDLLASRPVVLFGKFRGEAKGKIVVSGWAGGGRYETAIELKPELVKAENGPIRWLWARKWVAFLDDELKMTAAKEIEDAITDLGLSYTLLTTFTSFVAVDSEVANKSGKADKVNQPLPLPEGVSNQAVGGPSRAGGRRHRPAARPRPRSRPRRRRGERLRRHAGRGDRRRPGHVVRVQAEVGDRRALRFARAPSAAVSQPASPPARRKSSLAYAEEAEPDDAIAARLSIVDLKATGLGDTRALLAEIDKVLHNARDCAGASVRLRLTVNKAGKVVKVEVVNGDAALGACLQGKLKSLSSASVSEGATGTLEIVVRPIG
jgi:hypothetical protein